MSLSEITKSMVTGLYEGSVPERVYLRSQNSIDILWVGIPAVLRRESILEALDARLRTSGMTNKERQYVYSILGLVIGRLFPKSFGVRDFVREARGHFPMSAYYEKILNSRKVIDAPIRPPRITSHRV